MENCCFAYTPNDYYLVLNNDEFIFLNLDLDLAMEKVSDVTIEELKEIAVVLGRSLEGKFLADGFAYLYAIVSGGTLFRMRKRKFTAGKRRRMNYLVRKTIHLEIADKMLMQMFEMLKALVKQGFNVKEEFVEKIKYQNSYIFDYGIDIPMHGPTAWTLHIIFQ